jgi:hypothetical protein
MVDLETFGLTPDSAILTLGATEFSLDGSKQLGEKFHVGFTFEDQQDRRFDTSVFKWWLEQSEAARQSLAGRVGMRTLRAGLEMFQSYLMNRCCHQTRSLCVWANKINFDLAILEHAYGTLGVNRPWYYRNVRDYHTMRAEFGEDSDAAPKNDQAHDALADAIWQAETLQNLYARIGKTA